MSTKIEALANQSKVLFEIELKPLQGTRFQPTGFPNLGAATYQTQDGLNLLVESAQSMANRLEAVCWDAVKQEPTAALAGISYVRVERKGSYLTSSMTDAHRLNSPYMLAGSDKTFLERLRKDVDTLSEGPVNMSLLASALLKYDAGSLIHGVFLPKKELAHGRLRVARALSAFIEANGVEQAVSGGVKNDHVNPSGKAKDGFGNVPFSREEFTAERIMLYVNLDLAQIRGYGLGAPVEKMLILLALFKLRALVDGDLRLRTACNFELKNTSIVARRPDGFVLPALAEIEAELAPAIRACADRMVVTTVSFNDKIEKTEGEGKSEAEAEDAES